MYLSIVGILIIVSSLKYELAIVLPKKDKNAINILALSLIINFIFSSVILCIVLIFKYDILRILNLSDKYIIIVYLIPAGTFLISSFQSFNYWLIRKKAFYSISVNKLVRRGFEGFAQVLFALFRNAKGLILGDIIGQLSNIITVFYQSTRNGFSFRKISLAKISYVARKYSEFPKYNTLPSLMSSISYLLPVILINKFFSSENAGFFDLSKLLLSIPLALVASSLSSVLLQKISEKFRNRESIYQDIKPVLYLTGAIVVFEIIIIELFGVELFEFCFGKNWTISGELSKILVWSFALNFLASSFTAIFIAMNRIKIQSIWQLFYFLSILSLFFFRKLSFNHFIGFYVVIEVVCSAIILFLVSSIVFRYERSIVKR